MARLCGAVQTHAAKVADAAKAQQELESAVLPSAQRAAVAPRGSASRAWHAEASRRPPRTLPLGRARPSAQCHALGRFAPQCERADWAAANGRGLSAINGR